MRTSLVVAAGVLLVMMASSSAASAQGYNQLREWCFGDSTDDQTIQGCNAVVLSNQEPQQNKGDAIGNRALAYKHKGQLDRAMEDYDEAVRLSPQNSNNFNLRGSLYDTKGQPERAIQDYNQAIKLDPNSSTAYNNRGLAYIHLDQIDRGIQDYTQAIKLNPNYSTAYSNRGIAFQKKGMVAQAKADQDKADLLKKQGH